MKLRKIVSLLLALLLSLTMCTAAFASAKPSDEPSGEASSGEPEDLFAKPAFPTDAKIVSATMNSVYTKNPVSVQDAVIQATLYWDLTNDRVFDIRFVQPMLPWDDNGNDMGWACIKDETLEKALNGALVTLGEGDAAVRYAKYLQIGGIVWTGSVGSTPACAQAIVYSAEIDGKQTTLLDYVSTPEGGAWYVDASREDVYFLATPKAAKDANAANVAQIYHITYKDNNGHGVFFWLSDITYPGNIQAIKDFVTEHGFGYDYYADGGITQTEDGYWQTVDAVSGATLDEAPTYLDMLKTLYDRIMDGDYVEEN